MAYRQCPVRTPQFVVAALRDPSTGRAAFFVLPGMAFGQTSSVNQFNRLDLPTFGRPTIAIFG